MLAQLRAKQSQLQPVDTVETDRQGNRRVVRQGQVIGTQASQAGFVVDTKPDPQLAPVCPGVFVGSQDAALHWEGLQEKGVTHILCLVEGIAPAYPDAFTYCTVPLYDLDDQSLSPDVLTRCFDFIQQARDTQGACLVHCNAGVSRSCSIVLAYRMSQEPGLLYEKALEELRAVRPAARPNDGFARQLRAMNRSL